MVNLPIALTFQTDDEVGQFASNINTIIHGKVRVKTDIVGNLGGQIVAIFYLQRNNEYSQIRDEFVRLIENEECQEIVPQKIALSNESPHDDNDDPWTLF